jgi:PadR family transcriptional regulator PadR
MVYIYKTNLLSRLDEGMSGIIPRGMKLGAVSLWLLLLLSERPMYGYEIIRELEKRFSGYWKPKTGTIYPALEKLEQSNLVTSRIEFRDEGPDRKHYALTEKGRAELSQAMSHWTKMIEILENYREVHESIFRHKSQTTIAQLSKTLLGLGESLRSNAIPIKTLFPTEKDVTVTPREPMTFKFLYAKENHRFEIHMEIEWIP